MAKSKKTPEQRFEKDMQEFFKYLNILMPREVDDAPVDMSVHVEFADEAACWYFADESGMTITLSMSTHRRFRVMSLLHRFLRNFNNDGQYDGASFDARYEIFDCADRLKIVEVGV